MFRSSQYTLIIPQRAVQLLQRLIDLFFKGAWGVGADEHQVQICVVVVVFFVYFVR